MCCRLFPWPECHVDDHVFMAAAIAAFADAPQIACTGTPYH
jgi:hypothetical protein